MAYPLFIFRMLLTLYIDLVTPHYTNILVASVFAKYVIPHTSAGSFSSWNFLSHNRRVIARCLIMHKTLPHPFIFCLMEQARKNSSLHIFSVGTVFCSHTVKVSFYAIPFGE